MEIKKVLRIKSPVHLNGVIDGMPEVLETATGDVYLSLRYYVDLASEYLYGCKCDEESNWVRLKNEYSNAMRHPDIIGHLESSLGCDRIEFSDDYE